MTFVERHLTNNAWGKRTASPVALACIHVTANPRTAKYTDLHAAADAERDYANRAGSDGPSAHYYVARDGWAIEAINPNLYWAWSNGDFYTTLSDGTKRWNKGNLDNPGVQRVFDLTKRGYNANQGYWLEFENVGYGSDYPVNAAQRQFCAERIAAMAQAKGMKINRETVHGHWEINGIDRPGCPSPNHEGFLNDVIARANALLPPESEDEMLTVTDRSPKNVALSVGAKLYDPATGALVTDMGVAAVRTSYYATPIGRVIDITTGGAVRLVAVRASDTKVVISEPTTADPTPFDKADLDAAAVAAAKQEKERIAGAFGKQQADVIRAI